MSGRLCCYKQQQHSKLLAQSVFKVSAFHFNNTRTKTRAPLPNCRINNVLIQFVPTPKLPGNANAVKAVRWVNLTTPHTSLSRA